MKRIEGVTYYSLNDVSALLGKTPNTIKLWEQYSDELEANGENRLIPKAHRIGGRKEVNLNFRNAGGKIIETKGNRFWTEKEVKQIVTFSQNLKRGDLAEFSRKQWGKRGEAIAKRKKLKEIDKHLDGSKEMENARKLNRLKGGTTK